MIWGAILFGFFSVFGWNTGQKVWDKYIEPELKTSVEQAKDTKEKQ
jgi:Icc-related predicted phosphoesterase